MINEPLSIPFREEKSCALNPDIGYNPEYLAWLTKQEKEWKYRPVLKKFSDLTSDIQKRINTTHKKVPFETTSGTASNCSPDHPETEAGSEKKTPVIRTFSPLSKTFTCSLPEDYQNRKTREFEQLKLRSEHKHFEILRQNQKIKKGNREEIEQFLTEKGIHEFYHFTDRRNLPSIRKNGGLFSRDFIQTKGRNIKRIGSCTNSLTLQEENNLQTLNFIKLSFCNKHPLTRMALENGYMHEVVLLKIRREVACIKSTRFSDREWRPKDYLGITRQEDMPLYTQTSEMEEAEELAYLKKINFQSIRESNYSDWLYEKNQYYQPEILVKDWIPLDYIKNIHRC